MRKKAKEFKNHKARNFQVYNLRSLSESDLQLEYGRTELYLLRGTQSSLLMLL